MTAPVRVPGPADLSDRLEPSDALVRIEGVAKTYTARRGAGAVTALEDIDLSVPRGRVLGVIGRSGAGKSTLIRLVNGLERPSRGRVVVDGAEISRLPESALRAERRGIGMIFQHFNLLSARTAAGNVALPLEVAGYDKAAIRTRVAELLDLVGLSAQADRYPAELSGGQKQRVGIARALATNPKVLLSDEATSALDPETTRSILDLLGRINRELGLTILLITHEMAVIRAIAHEVAVLDGGRIAESGDVFEVFTRPKAAITRTFLDEESGRALPPALAARLTPGPVAAGEGKQAVLRITFRGPHATDPVLAQLTRDAGIPAGILSGTVDEIAGRPFGTLVVGIPPDPEVVRRATDFLVARGLDVELLGTLDLAGWQRSAAPTDVPRVVSDVA
ncbi:MULTISPECIES: methionine ABC transporter ATP-binding protein [Methylobacterium]|uniref:methionine ABC transporter ATP-binding protein n=1 Tax=Methylobacterium TaxID=407 RepID=UPI0013EC5218|nr:methionine ABC transporter ATP-binding protein [Methylobacterium sp. DB0501]NGM38156.1 methionine ABC transporter ATP-binding protein [Methylobacterium sp. DB0501]